ncbi:hypothetical protein EVAR_13916_1 [Eumeta japonica]|uniref:Uncharacterized protein n=1 Tax=Eumeta variegata TaxID=151549 RepID=A0A4C1U9R8_EUMVA|nr:hypothetical protein EVAR_13916_1 [Eumeta japonica]
MQTPSEWRPHASGRPVEVLTAPHILEQKLLGDVSEILFNLKIIVFIIICNVSTAKQRKGKHLSVHNGMNQIGNTQWNNRKYKDYEHHQEQRELVRDYRRRRLSKRNSQTAAKGNDYSKSWSGGYGVYNNAPPYLVYNKKTGSYYPYYYYPKANGIAVVLSAHIGVQNNYNYDDNRYLKTDSDRNAEPNVKSDSSKYLNKKKLSDFMVDGFTPRLLISDGCSKSANPNNIKSGGSSMEKGVASDPEATAFDSGRHQIDR